MITNPLPMLYDRVAVLRQFAGDDVPVEGRIVFSMRGEFPKGRPESVIRLDELQDQFPAVERAAGGAAAAAFAGVWERIKQARSRIPSRADTTAPAADSHSRTANSRHQRWGVRHDRDGQ
jgi:hypothetical protein